MRTGNDIFTLLSRTIADKIAKTNSAPKGTINSGVGVSDATSDQLAELLKTVAGHQTTLEGILQTISNSKQQIVTGGTISETDPPSTRVQAGPVTAFCPGTGVMYTLSSSGIVDVLNSSRIEKPGVAFILLNATGGVEVSASHDPAKVTLGKVVIPTADCYRIVNDKINETDAYIIMRKDLFFEEDFKLDDETIAELRGIMDKLLADNLIGNIKLSENLTITNTDGSLELNSLAMKLKYPSGNLGMLLDKSGIKFYDSNQAMVAYFTTEGAKVASIKVTGTGLESTNFISGQSGFQIKANGNVEFFNGVFRGTITAISGKIGGWNIGPGYLYNDDQNVYLDAVTGELRLKNPVNYKMAINPDGLFLEAYRIPILNNFIPDQHDYIRDVTVRGASTLQVIDPVKYLYGGKSGSFIIPANYAGASDYLDNNYNVLIDYTANSSGFSYTGECYIFEMVRGTAALITLDNVLDVQYVKNLIVGTADISDLAVTNAKVVTLDGQKIFADSITADKIDVAQLSAITVDAGCIVAGVLQNAAVSPESFFNLGTGKLGIKTNDVDPNHILAVGTTTGPAACQYMVYDTSTGRLTVRSNDFVRNVLDFGGYTSAAVQAAINDLPSNGGRIYIPPGTYTINSAITVNKTACEIFGAGNSTILNCSVAGATTGAFRITASNCKISKIKMVVDAACNGIYGGGGSDIISDVWIEGGNYQIKLTSSGITIERCYLNGAAQAIWMEGGSPLKYSSIDRCYINASNVGAEVTGAFTHITNNTFYCLGGNGALSMLGPSDSGTQSNIIADNEIYANNTALYLGGIQIMLRVTGNSLWSNNSACIFTGTAALQRSIISQNVAYSDNWHCFHLNCGNGLGLEASSGVIVANNVCRIRTVLWGLYGIAIMGGQKVLVHGNIVENTIYVDPGAQAYLYDNVLLPD